MKQFLAPRNAPEKSRKGIKKAETFYKEDSAFIVCKYKQNQRFKLISRQEIFTEIS